MADSAQYQFYYRNEYWDELDKRLMATSFSSRVLVASMPLDPGDEQVARILDTLASTASRGVNTTLLVDAHSFLADGNRLGPLWWHTELPARLPAKFQRKVDALKTISQHPSGHVTILNKPKRRFSLPQAGRCHIKLAIVDNYVFIPTHNLEHNEWTNLAIGFENKVVADQLFTIMSSAAHVGNMAEALKGIDQAIPVDDTALIFIDAGVRGQSVIMEKALTFIDNATDWLTITCQYFPNSVTAQHLLGAKKRGVDTTIVYSHPKQQGRLGGFVQHVSNTIERIRLPSNMFTDALSPNSLKMHTKLLASDKGMILGSHNFVRAGVKLGTAEIAIKIQDGAVARQAVLKALQLNETDKPLSPVT